jgi:hypothetical protein
LVLAFYKLRNILIERGKQVGPIIALSYKNHAIDEFLLDVIKQETHFSSNRQSLIRLGKPEEEKLMHHTEKNSNLETAATN